MYQYSPLFTQKTNNNFNELNLKEDDIYVYWANLDQPQGIVDNYQTLLCSDEIERISKYNTQVLRNRQVMSKSILRKMLSLYLKINAQEINLIHNNFGKPFVTSANETDSIKFNISHSENIGIFAFSLNDLGIDIEKIKEYIEIDGIKEICFTDFEKRWYDNINNEYQLETFYKIWTIKEAFIKAIGQGFSYPTLNIELTNELGNQIQIKKIYSNEYADSNYQVNTFSCIRGFIASIVYKGKKRINILPLSKLDDFGLAY